MASAKQGDTAMTATFLERRLIEENIYKQFLIHVEDYVEETWKKKVGKHHEKSDEVIIFKNKSQIIKQEKDVQNTQYTYFKGSDDIEEWIPEWNDKLSEVINNIFK